MTSQTSYRNLNFTQVPCSRPVLGDEFGGGEQLYSFSISQGQAWIPGLSYLRVRMRLEIRGRVLGVDTWIKPEPGMQTAFADGAVANLFSAASFRVGSQDVSSVTSYLPQVYAIQQRTNKSFAWFQTVGRSMYGLEGFQSERALAVQDANDRVFMYQPPLGAWAINPDINPEHRPLGSGSYQLSLTPQANFQTTVVESSLGYIPGSTYVPPGGGAILNYRVVVSECQLFIATVNVHEPASGTDVLDLEEMAINVRPATQGSGQSSLDYTVKPSCYALTVACQSTAAGTSTKLPLSKFWPADGAGSLSVQGADLRQLQIQYAGVQKPAISYSSAYTTLGTNPEANALQQRYMDTITHAGLSNNDGGAPETYESWLERGPIYHYSWERPENDRSTAVAVNITYGDINANTQILLCESYKKRVSITVERGQVVNVVSVIA